MKYLFSLLVFVALAPVETNLYANSFCSQLISAVPDAHIILVDDDPTVRMVIKKLFSMRTRINVKDFSGATETLAFLESTELPIVGAIVDKQLRGEDGEKLALQILEKGIPAVVCTGNCALEVPALGLSVLPKPPNEATIKDTMEMFAEAYLKKLVPSIP